MSQPQSTTTENVSKKRKLVYSFNDGDGSDKKLLGGKGANLCEMTQIGLNVPPGFVITTEACLEYLDVNDLPADLFDAVGEEIAALEKVTGKGFGNAENPLLVSVRSGSAMSMLSLIHISEPTRLRRKSRMPSSA